MIDVLQQGLMTMGVNIDNRCLERELMFIDELLRWNKKINLTAVRERHEALEKHLIDSLVVLNFVHRNETVLDVGSGGGLPGIPLAIADSSLTVTSVDSVGKKINFQKHIKRLLKLNNFHAENIRVENLDSKGVVAGYFDTAVTRAFSSLDTVFNVTAQWVAVGGRILALKGPEGMEEVDRVKPHIDSYGFDNLEVNDYKLPFSKAQRYIITARKTS